MESMVVLHVGGYLVLTQEEYEQMLARFRMGKTTVNPAGNCWVVRGATAHTLFMEIHEHKDE